MEKNTIGKFISALRRSSGMTQRELGEKLYVSDKTVSRWERDECTPELNLIPAIAEIFGVTTDELLRGARCTDPADTPAAAARLKGRADKQLRTMLQQRTTRFRSRSLITRGIALTGVIAAAICDLCFHQALIGFFLALIFLVGAAVCQLCFLSGAWLYPDEEEPEHHDAMAAVNAGFTRTAVSVFALLGCCLVFLLPLLVGAHVGLSVSSWLLLGLPFAAAALIAGHLLYVWWLAPCLLHRGWLDEQDAARMERSRVLIRKLCKPALIATVIVILAVSCVQSLGGELFVAAEKFTSWSTFESAMYDRARQEADEEWAGFHVEFLPGGYQVYGEGFALDDPVIWETRSVTDKSGRVLATYPATDSTALISFSFDRSDDGLPVQVWSQADLHTGYQRRQLICSMLAVLAALVWGGCAAVYLIRRRA